MKTERRHELQTNVLADWIGIQLERLQPYSKLAMGILVAIVVALGLYSYLKSQSATRNEQGWQQYYQAMDNLQQKGAVEDLQQLAESSEFANTPVGNWAVLSLADHHLREGITQLFNDRAAASKSLRSAVDGYTRIVDHSKSPTLEDRAVLGAGRAYESLNELDKARAAYEMLAAKGSGPFASEAQQRLRDLGANRRKRFYDWFFAATPPRQGFGGISMPGTRPDFNSLPDERSLRRPPPTVQRRPKHQSTARRPRRPKGTRAKPDGATEAAPQEPAINEPPAEGKPDAPPATPEAKAPEAATP